MTVFITKCMKKLKGSEPGMGIDLGSADFRDKLIFFGETIISVPGNAGKSKLSKKKNCIKSE